MHMTKQQKIHTIRRITDNSTCNIDSTMLNQHINILHEIHHITRTTFRFPSYYQSKPTRNQEYLPNLTRKTHVTQLRIYHHLHVQLLYLITVIGTYTERTDSKVGKQKTERYASDIPNNGIFE